MNKMTKLQWIILYLIIGLTFMSGFFLGAFIGAEYVIASMEKVMSMANVKVDKVEFSINETRLTEIAYEIAETNGYLQNLTEEKR